MDALFHYSICRNKRLTKSSAPDAAQGHFTMMSLDTKLRSVPSNYVSWQDYSENIINTAEAFKLHLKSGGYYGGPTVAFAINEIGMLLERHQPQQIQKSLFAPSLVRHIAR